MEKIEIIKTFNIKLIFYLILIAFTLYGILFIIKSSLVVNGVRYFTLFDDAMISMCYAKNFANGYGLVWNPGGERVEGYTNLLWTMYMAFWHLLPISSAKISLPLQVSGLLLLIGSLVLVRKISEHISNGNAYVIVASVVLTASYQPINYWALKGMETSVLGFIILLSVWRVFVCIEHNRFDPLLFVILGTALLIRPDASTFYLGVGLFLMVAMPEHRKKNILLALAIFLVIQGSMTMFRLLYYNDILPNTYYLKMTGVPATIRIQRGLKVALQFVSGMSYILFALPFAYSLLYAKNKKVWFMLYLFLIQVFYSIYVGGDAWDYWGHLANRYICIVMPLFFIVLSLVINFLLQQGTRYLRMGAFLKKCCFIILIVITIIQMHRGFGSAVLRNLLNFPTFLMEEDKNNVLLALKIKEITTTDAKIAVGAAGAPPYFSDRLSIDLLGKNDAYIAHQKAKGGWGGLFNPGHNKYDWGYSIGELKPDIVLFFEERWYNKQEEKYFKKHYRIFKIKKAKELLTSDLWTIYARVNSPNIDWTKGTVIEWPTI
jgi:hypothetical protein